MNKMDNIHILKIQAGMIAQFCYGMVSGHDGLGKSLRAPLQMVLQMVAAYHLVRLNLEMRGHSSLTQYHCNFV